MKIFTQLKRLLKGLNDTILAKVLSAILGVSEVRNLRVFLKLSIIMCISEFPQDFSHFICQYFVVSPENSHSHMVHTSRKTKTDLAASI